MYRNRLYHSRNLKALSFKLTRIEWERGGGKRRYCKCESIDFSCNTSSSSTLMSINLAKTLLLIVDVQVVLYIVSEHHLFPVTQFNVE